jgi:hypothetical protein
MKWSASTVGGGAATDHRAQKPPVPGNDFGLKFGDGEWCLAVGNSYCPRFWSGTCHPPLPRGAGGEGGRAPAAEMGWAKSNGREP